MPPVNDNFADAQEISGASGNVTFDITDATLEAGETDYTSGFLDSDNPHTVWFYYDVSEDGTLQLSTAGTPPPRWDSLITAYVMNPGGSGIADLGFLGQNDDGDLQPGVVTDDGYGTSSLAIDVFAGDRIYIQVSSYEYSAYDTNPSAGYPRDDCNLAWSLALRPVIDSVSPSSVSDGSHITITGSRFTDTVTVTVAGVPISFSIVDDSTITATISTAVPKGLTKELRVYLPTSSAATYVNVYYHGRWIQEPDAPVNAPAASINLYGIQTGWVDDDPGELDISGAGRLVGVGDGDGEGWAFTSKDVGAQGSSIRDQSDTISGWYLQPEPTRPNDTFYVAVRPDTDLDDNLYALQWIESDSDPVAATEWAPLITGGYGDPNFLPPHGDRYQSAPSPNTLATAVRILAKDNDTDVITIEAVIPLAFVTRQFERSSISTLIVAPVGLLSDADHAPDTMPAPYVNWSAAGADYYELEHPYGAPVESEGVRFLEADLLSLQELTVSDDTYLDNPGTTIRSEWQFRRIPDGLADVDPVGDSWYSSKFIGADVLPDMSDVVTWPVDFTNGGVTVDIEDNGGMTGANPGPHPEQFGATSGEWARPAKTYDWSDLDDNGNISLLGVESSDLGIDPPWPAATIWRNGILGKTSYQATQPAYWKFTWTYRPPRYRLLYLHYPPAPDLDASLRAETRSEVRLAAGLDGGL